MLLLKTKCEFPRQLFLMIPDSKQATESIRGPEADFDYCDQEHWSRAGLIRTAITRAGNYGQTRHKSMLFESACEHKANGMCKEQKEDDILSQIELEVVEGIFVCCQELVVRV